MTKHLTLVTALFFAGTALATDEFASEYLPTSNLDGSISSSVLCQPQSPYSHNDNVVYENGRIKALTYATVTCPVEVNNDLRQHSKFTYLHVWIRANNTYSTSRVQCRLKNFDWRGLSELNTPWVTTNSDGHGNATLVISADYVVRGGQTTMECIMPAYTYIENYQTEPRFTIL